MSVSVLSYSGGRLRVSCEVLPDDPDYSRWAELAEDAGHEQGVDYHALAEAYAACWTAKEKAGAPVTEAELMAAAEALEGGDWHVLESENGWEACWCESGFEMGRRIHDEKDFGWKATTGGKHHWVCRRNGKLRYSDAQRPPGEIGSGRSTKKPPAAKEQPKAAPTTPQEPPRNEKKQDVNDPPHRHTQAHEALAHILGEGHEKIDLSDREGLKKRLATALADKKEEAKKAEEAPKEAPKPEPVKEAEREQGREEERPAEREGSERDADADEGVASGVEKEAGRPAGTGADQVGGADRQPADREVAGDEPDGRAVAAAEEVDRRLNRFENFFRSRGRHEIADWLGVLREHVNAVGPEAALDALGGAGEPRPGPVGPDGKVQYWGVGTEEQNWKNNGDFMEAYLARNGIVAVTGEHSFRGIPLISALGKPDQYLAGDFKPESDAFKDKLDEAKHLPGLEASEDLGKLVGSEVTHLTPEVIAKLDETYGAGKWIVKCYSDEAAAGYGIFFPQRAAAIKQDAGNGIWTAGEKLSQYGFSLDRDPKSGEITGIVHEGGDVYPFDSDEYDSTIDGEVREWADAAAEAAQNERGALLPEGKFMVQPAFPAANITDEERAAGKTWDPQGEGRVHMVTRPDGTVSVVPNATWLKGGDLPITGGFTRIKDKDGVMQVLHLDVNEVRAMEKAAQDAINKLPAKARRGQVYAPDVMKTKDGYKVVELNAQGDYNGSGYLHDNHFTIDAYTSHLTGREPAHVKFIKQLLTEKKGRSRKTEQPQEQQPAQEQQQSSPEPQQQPPSEEPNNAGPVAEPVAEEKPAGPPQGSGGESGGVRPEESRRDDAGAAAGGDTSQRSQGHAPKEAAEALQKAGVGSLPVGSVSWERWRQPEHLQAEHNAAVMKAAQEGGFFIEPHDLPKAINTTPNVGGNEHDVHQDAENNTYYKLTRDGHYGYNKDLPEYLERHRIANDLWPSLGYKLQGITRDFQGRPQAVMSMNRISGSHPEQHEIESWFRSNGWEPAPDQHEPEKGVRNWVDPVSGTRIFDAHPGNFIKNEAGLAPIDVDILPAELKG